MASKQYNGRLAYDSDTDYHLADDGTPVVTPDHGKTWHYADSDDPSHYDRYHQQFATVDTTANTLAELQMEHGREKAEELWRDEQPHHFDVQPDDPHADRVKTDPDPVAETITSHTAAYSGGDQ